MSHRQCPYWIASLFNLVLRNRQGNISRYRLKTAIEIYKQYLVIYGKLPTDEFTAKLPKIYKGILIDIDVCYQLMVHAQRAPSLSIAGSQGDISIVKF